MSVNIYNATQDTLTRVDGGGLEYKDINIEFANQTWVQSSSGKYYAIIDPSLPSGSTMLAVSVSNWYYLKATDNILPTLKPATGEIYLMSNVNMFSTNAQCTIRILYC